MRMTVLLTLALATAGCTGAPGEPTADVGVVLTPNGVRLAPRVQVPVAQGTAVTIRP